MKEVNTQFGISHSADFEENTWTFLMPDKFNVWAGEFAIVYKQVYDKMLAALKEVDDAHDYYAPNSGMTNSIFKNVSMAVEAAEANPSSQP